ncbi:MAG: hypothetical protein ACRDDY_03730 [Clostridium sp.]|uniref:hypothetical protein n=1 Tax=Clostridium sp. TaxID=1506 RepID=UPI003EE4285C
MSLVLLIIVVVSLPAMALSWVSLFVFPTIPLNFWQLTVAYVILFAIFGSKSNTIYKIKK